LPAESHSVSGHAGDPHFGKWGCIILDEAHERKADADALLPAFARACAARPELKIIVMSATIEPSVYVDNLHANWLAGGCSVIVVSTLAPRFTSFIHHWLWLPAARSLQVHSQRFAMFASVHKVVGHQ
jgi:hypothetical protein